MEHLFCPECWAAVFAFLATMRFAPTFFRVWAEKWRNKLAFKHINECKSDACHHDHDDHGEKNV